MAIPSSVEKILNDSNIEYVLRENLLDETGSTSPATDLPNDYTAVSLLISDSGQAQVLFPKDRLLDFEKLTAATQREFKPLGPDDITKLRTQFGLQAIPALPEFMGLETFVDESLLNNAKIITESGEAGNLLEFDQAALKPLLDKAQVGEFTQPIPEQQTTYNENWIEEDLSAINNAVSNFTSLRIKQRLAETLDMPTLPETAQQIIKLRVDPNAETTQLADVVEKDASLSAQVVSWAASPYYASSGNIKSVNDAVVRVLGFDLVINLALGLSLGRTLSVPKNSPRGYSPYWQQSIFCAATLQKLCRLVPSSNRPSAGLAYLAGLLHNFGFMILAYVFPPHFKNITRHVEANPHINRADIEQHLLSITREQISSSLMLNWHVPLEVCTALRYQNHACYDGEHWEYANLIYVAMRLLRRHGIGDAPNEPIPDELYQRLGFNEEDALEVIEGIMESSDDLKAMTKMFSK